MRVFAVTHRGKPPLSTLTNEIHGDVGKRNRHDLIQGIGISAAQLVSEVADHRFLACAFPDLLS